jgi:hypothetical protein
MASEYAKVQCSCIHSFNAWITVIAASGSSATRSSSTLANVGHNSVRSMPISFISAKRGSGSKKASMPGITTSFAPPLSCVCSPLALGSPIPPPPLVTSNPAAPGAATFTNVGFGM